MKSLKIRQKIILIVSLSLLGYIILSAIFMKNVLENKNIANFQDKLIETMQKLSNLMLSIQKERGLTYSYLNGEKELYERVQKQREETDKLIQIEKTDKLIKIDKLMQIEQTDRLIKNIIKEKISSIKEDIDKTRLKVNEGEKPFYIFTNYTKTIEKIINVYGFLLNQKTSFGIGKRLSSILALEEIKEGISAFRGLSSGIFAKNRVDEEEIKLLINYFSNFNGILNMPGLVFSENTAKMLEEFKNNKILELIKERFNLIITKQKEGNFGISATENFNTITEAVNTIQSILENEKNFVSQENNKIIETVNIEIILNIFLLVVTLGVIIILVFYISRSITTPLKEVSLKLNEISSGEGDLTSLIEVSTKDESGMIANYFNNFVEKLRLLINDLKNHSEKLRKTSEEIIVNTRQNKTVIKEVLDLSNTTLSKVENSTNKIEKNAKTIEEIIEEIKSIDEITTKMKEQLSQASSSIEEMAANILNTSKIASYASSSSEELEKVSLKGKDTIEELDKSIESVGKNSEEIIDMVKLIMDISEQTNLLAINAAIEAAHAGEYGKGFAVVAEEIRKLADKSTASAKEIQDVIKTITGNIRQTIKLSQEAKQGFATLGNEIKKVKQINHEIATSMDEQKIANKSILEVTTNLNSISDLLFERMKEQVQKGNIINDSLEKIRKDLEDIENSVKEQKNSIEETNEAFKKIEKTSNDIKDISEKINQEFGKFKT